MKFSSLTFCGLLVVLTLNVSCKKPIKTRADLISYINNPQNGLKDTIEIGKIKAELIYKPWQLMAVNNGGIKAKTDQNELNKLKSKYFFVLSLSANNKELLRQIPFDTYSEMVQTLAFRMIPYISIVGGNDKPRQPVDCIFLQTYGMSDANQLLIAFDKPAVQSAKQLTIKIKEFGLNIGNLNFHFETKKINELSTIAIN